MARQGTWLSNSGSTRLGQLAVASTTHLGRNLWRSSSHVCLCMTEKSIGSMPGVSLPDTTWTVVVIDILKSKKIDKDDLVIDIILKS